MRISWIKPLERSALPSHPAVHSTCCPTSGSAKTLGRIGLAISLRLGNWPSAWQLAFSWPARSAPRYPSAPRSKARLQQVHYKDTSPVSYLPCPFSMSRFPVTALTGWFFPAATRPSPSRSQAASRRLRGTGPLPTRGPAPSPPTFEDPSQQRCRLPPLQRLPRHHLAQLPREGDAAAWAPPEEKPPPLSPDRARRRGLPCPARRAQPAGHTRTSLSPRLCRASWSGSGASSAASARMRWAMEPPRRPVRPGTRCPPGASAPAPRNSRPEAPARHPGNSSRPRASLPLRATGRSRLPRVTAGSSPAGCGQRWVVID